MSKKLYAFPFLHKASLFESEAMAQRVEEKVDALNTIHMSASTSITLIRESKDLTTKGKQSALVDLQADVGGEIKEWQKANHHYADYAKQLEEKMVPKKARQDDLLQFLREQEMRQELKAMDILIIEGMYRDAVESGNDLLVDAIDNAPIPFKFATQGLINKMRFARLASQYPEEAQTLKDVRTAQEQVDSALKSSRADLLKQGLEILAEDPVAAAAA